MPVQARKALSLKLTKIVSNHTGIKAGITGANRFASRTLARVAPYFATVAVMGQVLDTDSNCLPQLASPWRAALAFLARQIPPAARRHTSNWPRINAAPGSNMKIPE